MGKSDWQQIKHSHNLSGFFKGLWLCASPKTILKLDQIGVRGKLLHWIEAFLTGHCQWVVIDGVYSEWAAVTSGAPQGSVIGPLLFLIYTNDIGSNLSSSTRLFADDYTIYREVSKQSDCEMLQMDLNNLHIWTQKWQLSLNASKCKAMRFTNKWKLNHYVYHLNNTPLEWCESYKYLGVILTRSWLGMTMHVSEVKLKATRILNLLRQTMYGCN